MPKLRKFREYGGGTFVDATGICNGRDVDYYKSLSAEDRRAHRRLHRLRRRRHRAAALLRARHRRLPHEGQFVHEITVGIGNTGAKAGVIKVGVSRGGRMTDLDKRIYRAAARAAVVTGAPILTHLAIDAEPAMTIFDEEGLPLDRVLFGHADDGVNARSDPRRSGSRAGRPHRLRHLRLRPRAAGPAVLGPQPRRTPASTSSTS